MPAFGCLITVVSLLAVFITQGRQGLATVGVTTVGAPASELTLVLEGAAQASRKAFWPIVTGAICFLTSGLSIRIHCGEHFGIKSYQRNNYGKYFYHASCIHMGQFCYVCFCDFRVKTIHPKFISALLANNRNR